MRKSESAKLHKSLKCSSLVIIRSGYWQKLKILSFYKHHTYQSIKLGEGGGYWSLSHNHNRVRRNNSSHIFVPKIWGVLAPPRWEPWQDIPIGQNLDGVMLRLVMENIILILMSCSQAPLCLTPNLPNLYRMFGMVYCLLPIWTWIFPCLQLAS